MKTLLVPLILAVGLTFSQVLAQQPLPLGSIETVQAHIDEKINMVDVAVAEEDPSSGEIRTIYHYWEVEGFPRSKQETAELVAKMFKKALDSILLRTNAEKFFYYASYKGTMKPLGLAYFTPNWGPQAKFRLIKDSTGKWVVPPEKYQVIWEVQPLMPIPFLIPGATSARLALQTPEGELEKVYDTVEDFDKPWGKEVGVYIFPKDYFPDDPVLTYIRYDLATSGQPGLLRVKVEDDAGKTSVNLYDLRNGSVLSPLKAEALPPPGTGPVLVKVAVNPEKSQVIEVADSVTSTNWTVLGHAWRWEIGEKAIPYTKQAEKAFYRVRWLEPDDE